MPTTRGARARAQDVHRVLQPQRGSTHNKPSIAMQAARLCMVDTNLTYEDAITKWFTDNPEWKHLPRPTRQAVGKAYGKVPESNKRVLVRAALADITNQVAHNHTGGRDLTLTPSGSSRPQPSKTQATNPINPLTGKPRPGRPTNDEIVARQLAQEKHEKLVMDAYDFAIKTYAQKRSSGKGFRLIARATQALPQFASVEVNKTKLKRLWVATEHGKRRVADVQSTKGRPRLIPQTIEEEIASVIDWMIDEGYRVSKQLVKHLVMQTIRGTQLEEVFDGGEPTDKWFFGFLKRTGLNLARSQPLETERAEWTNSQVIRAHYNCTAKVLTSLGFASQNVPFDENAPRAEQLTITKPERVFTMDETRCELCTDDTTIPSVQTTDLRERAKGARGDSTAAPAIGGRRGKRNAKASALAAKSDFAASAVGGSSMAGNSLPTFVVFNQPVVPESLQPRPTNHYNREPGFAVNEKGAVTTVELIQWLGMLCDCVGDVSPSNPILLICDGCGTHLKYEFLCECKKRGVHVVLRPPHTSHIIQPDDLITFKAFKTRFFQEKERLLVGKVAVSMLHVQKLSSQDFMRCFTPAWEAAFSRENVAKSWRVAGYMPFNRSVYWDLVAKERVRAIKESRIKPVVEGMVTNNVRLLSLLADAADVEHEAHEELPSPPPGVPADEFYRTQALIYKRRSEENRVGGGAPATAPPPPKKPRYNSAAVVNKNGGYATAPEIMEWGEKTFNAKVATAATKASNLEKRQKVSYERAALAKAIVDDLVPKLKSGERDMNELSRKSSKYVKADDIKAMLRFFGVKFKSTEPRESLREMLEANEGYLGALASESGDDVGDELGDEATEDSQDDGSSEEDDDSDEEVDEDE